MIIKINPSKNKSVKKILFKMGIFSSKLFVLDKAGVIILIIIYVINPDIWKSGRQYEWIEV